MNYIKKLIEHTIGKSISIDVKKLQENTNFDETFTDLEEYVKMGVSIED